MKAKPPTTSSTKNMVFSAKGVTLTCPVCLDSDTYKIGELDRKKWARGRNNAYTCADCRVKQSRPVHIFAHPDKQTNDLDQLMEMI